MLYSLIFRSRWTALLWAAGICFTAYRVSTAAAIVTPASDPASAHAEGQADTSGDAATTNSGGF
jgi:hypothetical protein